MTISVIMSTCARERPQYLEAAMKSIWADQERKPDEIVLVKDGPLTPQLDKVISEWKGKLAGALVVVTNDCNKGLPASLNTAIEVAGGDLLARMDSDDISLPGRFRLQEKYMEEHPNVEILGGSLHEFNDAGSLDNMRIYPATMADVTASIHRMSPVGHPSVMFRRSFFDKGFRYSGKRRNLEDIELWFDAVCAGCVINNIPETVLNFRYSESTPSRRRQKAWDEFMAYNRGIYRLNGLFTINYIYSVVRLAFRILPGAVSSVVYRNGKLRNNLAKKHRGIINHFLSFI